MAAIDNNLSPLQMRAATVLAQRAALEAQKGMQVVQGPDGITKATSSGVVGGIAGQVKPIDAAKVQQDSSEVSATAATAVATKPLDTPFAEAADKALDASFQLLDKAFDDGIISQQTREDVEDQVMDGTMSREAATYLAANVDALGGDVMVKIALELCKQDPAKFDEAFQSGNLYNVLAAEHHDRYYPAS